MIESPEKDFTTVTITMLKVLKKNWSIMRSTMEDIKVNVYKNRMPITENTVSEKFTGWS